MKSNVVDLGEWKEQKCNQQKEEKYKAYLKTLPNIQLEVEIDQIIKYPEESFMAKAHYILKEISCRAHSTVRKKIEQLSKDTLWH